MLGLSADATFPITMEDRSCLVLNLDLNSVVQCSVVDSPCVRIEGAPRYRILERYEARCISASAMSTDISWNAVPASHDDENIARGLSEGRKVDAEGGQGVG